MNETVVIGIGSNLGDRLAYVQKALRRLEKIISPLRCSSVVESEAHLLPGSPQEWDLPYLNCAVAGSTPLSPRALLASLKQIEIEMDAEKKERWAPRKIDLDILAYGERVIAEENLQIPHPELLNRPFALYPMGQLAPYWRHPVFGKTALELMHRSTPDFRRALLAKPFLVGILNLTPDSFSDGGLFLQTDKAIAQARHLWESGATLIDIGAASTRPGATLISHGEEWRRLEPVLKELKAFPIRLSIDTYEEETAIRALEEFEVDAINFVGPEIGRALADRIRKKGKQLVCMHSLTLPPTRSAVLPFEEDPISSLLTWAKRTIDKLGKEGLILDPGIGFGKTAAQSALILRRIYELKQIGVPLWVGHSRKSFMSAFSKEARDRDWQTAALSIPLMEAGVDYLRVHDVRKTMDLLAAHHSLSGGEVYALA